MDFILKNGGFHIQNDGFRSIMAQLRLHPARSHSETVSTLLWKQKIFNWKNDECFVERWWVSIENWWFSIENWWFFEHQLSEMSGLLLGPGSVESAIDKSRYAQTMPGFCTEHWCMLQSNWWTTDDYYINSFIDLLGRAVGASAVILYAQAFDLLRNAADAYFLVFGRFFVTFSPKTCEFRVNLAEKSGH